MCILGLTLWVGHASFVKHTRAAAVTMGGEVVGAHSGIDAQTGVRCLGHLMPVFAAFISCCYCGELKKRSECMSLCVS